MSPPSPSTTIAAVPKVTAFVISVVEPRRLTAPPATLKFVAYRFRLNVVVPAVLVRVIAPIRVDGDPTSCENTLLPSLSSSSARPVTACEIVAVPVDASRSFVLVAPLATLTVETAIEPLPPAPTSNFAPLLSTTFVSVRAPLPGRSRLVPDTVSVSPIVNTLFVVRTSPAIAVGPPLRVRPVPKVNTSRLLPASAPSPRVTVPVFCRSAAPEVTAPASSCRS